MHTQANEYTSLANVGLDETMSKSSGSRISGASQRMAPPRMEDDEVLAPSAKWDRPKSASLTVQSASMRMFAYGKSELTRMSREALSITNSS